MKNYLLAIGLSALIASYLPTQAINLPGKSVNERYADYVQSVNTRVLHPEKGWRKDKKVETPRDSRHRIVTTTDGQVGPVSTWGPLYTPSGEEWMYSAKFTYSSITAWSQTITGAEITIYDADYNVYSTLNTEFSLDEHETSINFVEVAPQLTRKFFDISDAYELMLYVHATTDDYAGHSYTQIFTLKDGSKIAQIEGNNIAAINTAQDLWSENFNMVFMREGFSEDFGLMLYFDVYSKAGWSGGCQLKHTFALDYQNVSGAGNAALPILVTNNNGKVFYATAAYEKPYFVDYMSDDVTPDNNLEISLYNDKFELVKVTKVPVELEEGATYSFPGVGELMGYDDLDFSIFGTPEDPAYIVGVENYYPAKDDFITSLYVYDSDGNRLHTICVNADDYRNMMPIEGQSAQICVLRDNGENPSYDMIDIPSCEVRATIPGILDGMPISSAFERVASADGYSIVSTLLAADSDDEGNAIHKILWFDADGRLTTVHDINLGKDIALAMPYIGADALSPYVFNTDNKMEYMFLVKKYVSSTSTRSTEMLRIYSEDSSILLELGPDPVTGEVLNNIFLSNLDSDSPRLVVSYYGNDEYTVRYVDLPLAKFGGGDGTKASPYLILCPGDLMSIYTAPSAHYKLAADLDFSGIQWKGNQCTFTGSLDGDGHTVSNLIMSGSGIFAEVASTASIKNIKFENAAVSYNTDNSTGLITGYAMGDGVNGPIFEGITIDGLYATGNGTDCFGVITGTATLFTTIRDCAVLGAHINLPNAYAAGIAGRLQTSTHVEVCLVEGEINAHTAAGIAAESFKNSETMTNCHVSATINGSEVAGGIVAEGGRSTVTNCYVEGEISATGLHKAYAGGIVGKLESNYDDEENFIIYNNIVAAKVSANSDATEHIAHRIAGFTSNDNWLIDWDSKSPNVNWEDPSTYPRIPDVKEVHLRDNYAYGVVKIDENVSDAHDTAEGQSLTDITADFLTQQSWKLGEDVTAPWQLGENDLALYFEDTIHSGIIDITAPADASIFYNGTEIVCQGANIRVFDTAGNLVAEGRYIADVSHLSKGIYIAVANGKTLKFAK